MFFASFSSMGINRHSNRLCSEGDHTVVIAPFGLTSLVALCDDDITMRRSCALCLCKMTLLTRSGSATKQDSSMMASRGSGSMYLLCSPSRYYISFASLLSDMHTPAKPSSRLCECLHRFTCTINLEESGAVSHRVCTSDMEGIMCCCQALEESSHSHRGDVITGIGVGYMGGGFEGSSRCTGQSKGQ